MGQAGGTRDGASSPGAGRVRRFRTYGEVDHGTGSALLEQVIEQRARLARRLAGVGATVAVASGKGGVGKSLVTANLAAALASRGQRVGAVDADLNGPSLARMLAADTAPLEDRETGVVPSPAVGGVRVISMELLQEREDAPLRWRDPGSDTFLWQSSMEATVLREFLADVDWGGADVLLIDVPPGTDKITRLLELVPDLSAMLLVTTPAEITRAVVARSLRLVREAGVSPLALVANMTGYACPSCNRRHRLFPGDGARELARATGCPIWAEVPFDPRLGEATERGRPLVLDRPDAPAAAAFAGLAGRIEALLDARRAAAAPAGRAAQ